MFKMRNTDFLKILAWLCRFNQNEFWMFVPHGEQMYLHISH